MSDFEVPFDLTAAFQQAEHEDLAAIKSFFEELGKHGSVIASRAVTSVERDEDLLASDPDQYFLEQTAVNVIMNAFDKKEGEQ